MSARSWLLRRALGRLRITDDITKQIGTDWVWPYWLERQLDPTSPAFVPRGDLPGLTNVTARNWTAVGNVGSPWEAIVDQRGMVTPWFDGWSLDWWIGADDRWHLPSREVAVRQRLIDDVPVVETAMRVPTGDAVQRVYAVQDGGGELVIVEIENRSKLPFAVALSVRPCNPEGLAVVERIGLHDGRTVTVDGRVAMLLPKAPPRTATSVFHDGDVASIVMSGAASEHYPTAARDEAGLASAAFIFPLAHTATLRVGLPMVATRRTPRRGLARRRAAKAPELPTTLPSAEQVASGWKLHVSRGMRLELPDARLASCVAAQRAFLLLLHDGDEMPGRSALRGALDRYGYDREVAEVLRSYPDRHHADAAELHAIAEHWRLHRDRNLVDALAPSIANGAERIDRKRRAASRRGDEARRGLPFGRSYRDDFWGIRGLLDAAEVLDVVGETSASRNAARMAEAFRGDVDRSLALTATRLGTAAMPAGPRRRIDPAVIGSLAACWPLKLMAADDERIVATADVVRERFVVGDAFFQGISHTGLGTHLTLQLALVELEAGDRRALRRLEWMLGAATPTWTWPEAVHPRLPGGCMGDGHHGWAAADVLTFVRNLLVRDTIGGGVALCSMLPDEWLGQGIEVHDAPTHAGTLSFAVRWHGDRPALLWELVPHAGVAPPMITAPGLDPMWSSMELSGDALLGPVAPPGQVSAVSLRRS